MSVRRSPTNTPTGGGSQPDLSKLNIMAEDSSIKLRKRKHPDKNCECSHEVKEIRSELARMTSVLEKYVESNQLMMSQMHQSITEVKTQITEIKSSNEQTVTLIHKNMSEVKAQISEIKSSSSSIIIEQNNIKTHVTHLENKISLGESKIKTLESKFSQKLPQSASFNAISSSCLNEQMIRELKERQEREKNVIIVGLAEQTSPNAEERISNDEAATINITSCVDKDIPKPTKILRIGKFNPGKNRRVKVCYDTPEPAKQLLRNKGKLPENIKIFSDQTPAQQKYMQDLKEELSRRQEDGEIDLTIKYIHGTPSIIKATSKNSNQ